MKRWVVVIFAFSAFPSGAQSIDPDLQVIRQRLDSLYKFTANVKLELDIDFINMAPKFATLTYVKGSPIRLSSDDFLLIPKKGLDFSFQHLWEYPFLTVDKGSEKRDQQLLKALSIIPLDKRADFTIANLLIDVVNRRIVEAELATKKDGTFTLLLNYQEEESPLPERVEVKFDIEQIRLPLSYLGKNAVVMKDKMNTKETKEGRILIYLTNYRVNTDGKAN
jgi:hypothetical protein